MEYEAEDVLYKAVIVHMPFTKKNKEPFNIEEDTYTYWAKLLRENVKPDIMICGHTHKLDVYESESEKDAFGQPCTIVEGAAPNTKEKKFTGSGFVFSKKSIEVVFTDGERIVDKKTVEIR